MEVFLASLAALLAGFIDAIVGGGGLVQVPALFIIFPGFKVPQIIGTNRFASFMGTSVAAYQYAQKVKMPWKVILATAVGAAIAAYLGALISSKVSEEILKPVVLILMTGIAIYTFMKKDLGLEESFKVPMAQIAIYGFIIGCCTGFYNGFVGPGTGSLLVFGFVSIIGFGFLRGSAIAKFVNVVADVSSLIFFLTNDYVVFKVAIPMMICNMIGSYAGSKLAIFKGNAFVRKFFLIVIAALILRFGWDVFNQLF
jgi:uncharacterized protein